MVWVSWCRGAREQHIGLSEIHGEGDVNFIQLQQFVSLKAKERAIQLHLSAARKQICTLQEEIM